MKRLLFALFMTSVSLAVSAQVIKLNGDTIATMTDIRAVYPSATGYKHIKGGVYNITEGKGVIGRVVITAPYSRSIKGFAGPTPLLIALNDEGKIRSVSLLHNSETPGFIRKVTRSGLFSKWDGMSLQQASSVGVDAVTGATFSSTSIIASLRAAAGNAVVQSMAIEEKAPEVKKDTKDANALNANAQKMDSQAVVKTIKTTDSTVLEGAKDSVAADSAENMVASEDMTSADVAPAKMVIPQSVWVKNISIIVLTLIALVMFFFPKKTSKLRLPFLIILAAVLGFWQTTMLSVAQVAMWLKNGVPVEMQWGILAVAILAIALPMFTGKKFYCIYVCPFGAMQELAGKVNKRHKLSLSARVVRVLMIIRKAIFLAVIMVILLGLNFDISNIEPFTSFDPSVSSLSALIIGIVSILLSVFVNKPWCRFFCPMGQGLDLFKGEKVKKIKG